MALAEFVSHDLFAHMKDRLSIDMPHRSRHAIVLDRWIIGQILGLKSRGILARAIDAKLGEIMKIFRHEMNQLHDLAQQIKTIVIVLGVFNGPI